MVKGIGGLGFLDSFHCEKTSFITVAGFVGLVGFAYLAFVLNDFPTVNFPFIEEPVTYLFLFVIVFVGGYLGVLYYRITNNKCIFCKDMLLFWNAEA